MHHAVQLPLSIDLGFSTQRKAVQALVAAQITKHRFYRCEAARNHLSARIRINFHLHPVDVIFRDVSFTLEERNLPCLSLFGCAQTFPASLARYAILFGSAKFHRRITIDGATRSIAVEPLARWTNAMGVIIRQAEIRGFKTIGFLCLFRFVPQWIRLSGMHVLIGIAFITLAVAVIGDVGIDLPLGQRFEVGLRMISSIGGDHGGRCIVSQWR